MFSILNRSSRNPLFAPHGARRQPRQTFSAPTSRTPESIATPSPSTSQESLPSVSSINSELTSLNSRNASANSLVRGKHDSYERGQRLPHYSEILETPFKRIKASLRRLAIAEPDKRREYTEELKGLQQDYDTSRPDRLKKARSLAARDLLELEGLDPGLYRHPSNLTGSQSSFASSVGATAMNQLSLSQASISSSRAAEKRPMQADPIAESSTTAGSSSQTKRARQQQPPFSIRTEGTYARRSTEAKKHYLMRRTASINAIQDAAERPYGIQEIATGLGQGITANDIQLLNKRDEVSTKIRTK